MATVIAQHQLHGPSDGMQRCAVCGITAHYTPSIQHRYGVWPAHRAWRAPDGRTWETTPGEPVPSCPPPGVEALCPWEEYAPRYAGPKGDVQLATALVTWCERHQMAVADCPEPGPYCRGRMAHEDGEEGRPGPCTGREDSCRCMCPACCGDTPDMYGYDGDC